MENQRSNIHFPQESVRENMPITANSRDELAAVVDLDHAEESHQRATTQGDARYTAAQHERNRAQVPHGEVAVDSQLLSNPSAQGPVAGPVISSHTSTPQIAADQVAAPQAPAPGVAFGTPFGPPRGYTMYLPLGNPLQTTLPTATLPGSFAVQETKRGLSEYSENMHQQLSSILQARSVRGPLGLPGSVGTTPLSGPGSLAAVPRAEQPTPALLAGNKRSRGSETDTSGRRRKKAKTVQDSLSSRSASPTKGTRSTRDTRSATGSRASTELRDSTRQSTSSSRPEPETRPPTPEDWREKWERYRATHRVSFAKSRERGTR